MNRRGFVGAALLAGVGFLFPPEVFSSEDNCTVERITEDTETRWGICGGGRSGKYFIGKGRNIYTGEIVEIHPFGSAEEALKAVRYHCNKKATGE